MRLEAVSLGARRPAPTARIVDWGGFTIGANPPKPNIPRFEIELEPPEYSAGFSFFERAPPARSFIPREMPVTVLPSALRMTGVISPPSIETATPMSACRNLRIRSPAQTAFAAGTRISAPAQPFPRPALDDEVVEGHTVRRTVGPCRPLHRS